MHILRCMGSKFCVKFQRAPLKFHTKFWTHTPQNVHFTVFTFCVWVAISLNCDVISLSETGPRCPLSHSASTSDPDVTNRIYEKAQTVCTFFGIYYICFHSITMYHTGLDYLKIHVNIQGFCFAGCTAISQSKAILQLTWVLTWTFLRNPSPLRNMSQA